jgi:hypothetical protein
MYASITTTTMIPLTMTVAIPTGLLLDAYPNALVAYSFRKLRAAYTGSAVRMRRVSDSVEQDIGFVGNDFDTASAATFIGASSGTIVTWYNQTGVGGSPYNVTSTSQPAYNATGLNSKPSMFFTSAPFNSLKTAPSAITLGGIALSTFAVCTIENTTITNRVLTIYQAGDADDYDATTSAVLLMQGNDPNTVECQRLGVTNSAKAIVYGTPTRMAQLHTGALSFIVVNGASSSAQTSTAAFGATVKLAVYCSAFNNVRNSQGFMSEAVLWAADQTANIGGIDSHQANYWGF